MSNDPSFTLSQEFVIQRPEPLPAFPIAYIEWNFLKSKISALSYKLNWHMEIGAALIGVAVSTSVAILIAGAIASAPQSETVSRAITIAWAVVGVAVIVAVVCIHFACQKEEVKRGHASEIVDHMEIIQTRYPLASNED